MPSLPLSAGLVSSSAIGWVKTDGQGIHFLDGVFTIPRRLLLCRWLDFYVVGWHLAPLGQEHSTYGLLVGVPCFATGSCERWRWWKHGGKGQKVSENRVIGWAQCRGCSTTLHLMTNGGWVHASAVDNCLYPTPQIAPSPYNNSIIPDIQGRDL